MVRSWVRSKPLVAIGGLASVFFSVMSTIGLLSAAGVPAVVVVGAMPFLIFGEITFTYRSLDVKY